MLFTKLGGSICMVSLMCVLNVQEARSSGGQEFRRPVVHEARSSGGQELTKRRPGGGQGLIRSSEGQGVARSGPGVQEAARGKPRAQELGRRLLGVSQEWAKSRA